jgi:hypothetical protein
MFEYSNIKKPLLIILAALAVVMFFSLREGKVTLGPGVFAPDDPIQTEIASPRSFALKNDYTVTPLADFHIKAKVLSKKNYRSGRAADLSPVDLALGWGRMSDESVLKSITIKQSGRWYHWRADKYPIPREEIVTHSANMHLVPEDLLVKADLKKARKGDIVEITGYLIKIEADDGWRWKSSLTRNDTGNHSCELVYVKKFEIRSR